MFGGTASIPLLWEGKCCGSPSVGRVHSPRSPVLCRPQPHALPPSCLRLQAPEPRSCRHRGDHLSPPCPGLCDERAGHLEEVGGPSLTDLWWVVTLCSQAPVSIPACAHMRICTCKHIAVQIQHGQSSPGPAPTHCSCGSRQPALQLAPPLWDEGDLAP